MGILFALVFVAIGVLALISYANTPHGGPTIDCGPIHVFGSTFTLHADCRYVSASELIVTIVFLLLGVLAALSARPHHR